MTKVSPRMGVFSVVLAVALAVPASVVDFVATIASGSAVQTIRDRL